MKIAICDDEKIYIETLNDILWTQPDCSVESFISPLKLIGEYENGTRYDVVFLDISMEHMNGMELAHKIREYDKKVAIIFLTSYTEYAPAGYEVRAFRYLLKPISKEKVLQALEDLRRDFDTYGKILLSTPECEFLLDSKDINYIEACDKECRIFYQNETLVLRKGLAALEKQFSPDLFTRIHRKYLVNLAHVREFDDTRLTLDCGSTLPVSRRKSREFRKALEGYIERGL